MTNTSADSQNLLSGTSLHFFTINHTVKVPIYNLQSWNRGWCKSFIVRRYTDRYNPKGGEFWIITPVPFVNTDPSLQKGRGGAWSCKSHVEVPGGFLNSLGSKTPRTTSTSGTILKPTVTKLVNFFVGKAQRILYLGQLSYRSTSSETRDFSGDTRLRVGWWIVDLLVSFTEL